MKRVKKSNQKCRGKLNTVKGSYRKVNKLDGNIFERSSYFHIHLFLNILGSIERSTQHRGNGSNVKAFHYKI